MEIAGDFDVETAHIASVLGLSPYDVRSRLVGGLPRVILQSSSAAEAARVEQALLARRHGVYRCDARDIVARGEMTTLRRFSFDAAGLWAHDRTGEALAWSHLGVVVVTALRTPVVRDRDAPTSRSDPSRPPELPTTQELVLTHAAYLFPRARKSRVVWLLDEQLAQYAALGTKMRATRHDNFFATVSLFRDLAPGAVFDDRFVARTQAPSSIVRVEGQSASTSGASLDLTAQVLARWIMRDQGGPYRG